MNANRTVLFLNASNLSTDLLYPYAFVQVSEIADRFNIRVIREDLFGIPQDQWVEYLQNTLTKIEFDMILITLRNTDTLGVEEYQTRTANKDYYHPIQTSPSSQSSYFPIEFTKRLIQDLRTITELPIAVGGFGFSVMPQKLMRYLRPDYGVFSGPDAFFGHFEDILAKRDLEQVANLLRIENDILLEGPTRYFPPATRREYTDDIIADAQKFNSRMSPIKGLCLNQSVAVEIFRGCPLRCSFCSEPFVKGTRLQYRDLDVIEDEIKLLGKYGLNQLWFVCSELNPDGSDFIMKLADRLIRINEKRAPHEKVQWYGIYLLTFTSDELKHLRKSGFLGGWFDLPSLEDKNNITVRMPYRSRDVIKHLKGMLGVVEEELRQSNKKMLSLEERIFKDPQHTNLSQLDPFLQNVWNLFLGNTATTPETIRVTLKAVDDAKLGERFDMCHIIPATRLFDYNMDDELLEFVWSVTDKGPADSYNELYPSFAHPPALLNHFGSREAVEELFVHIGTTYLSCDHLFKKEWNWFLRNSTDPKTFLGWWNTAVASGFDFKFLTAIPEVRESLSFIHTSPSAERIGLLFNPTPGWKPLMNFTAHMAIQFVLLSQEKELHQVMEFLGMSSSLDEILALSPYKVAAKLFEQHADKEELFVALDSSSSSSTLSRFFVEYLLYLNNVPLSPKYRVIFEQHG
ncbi:MAG: hypothetical protein ACE5H4_10965 [Candidatus Thorarchaeota archaeon]